MENGVNLDKFFTVSCNLHSSIIGDEHGQVRNENTIITVIKITKAERLIRLSEDQVKAVVYMLEIVYFIILFSLRGCQ